MTLTLLLVLSSKQESKDLKRQRCCRCGAGTKKTAFHADTPGFPWQDFGLQTPTNANMMTMLSQFSQQLSQQPPHSQQPPDTSNDVQHKD
jgi:hypothetical protein